MFGDHSANHHSNQFVPFFLVVSPGSSSVPLRTAPGLPQRIAGPIATEGDIEHNLLMDQQGMDGDGSIVKFAIPLFFPSRNYK